MEGDPEFAEAEAAALRQEELENQGRAYYDYRCQICAVSFEVARIRHEREHETSAWDDSGREGTFIRSEQSNIRKCIDRNCGCFRMLRETIFNTLDAEHIAGPHCVCTDGYSGHRITMNEMKGCRDIQCLVLKTAQERASWTISPDDQEFEVQGKHFLTGIGRGSSRFRKITFEENAIRHGRDIVEPLEADWQCGPRRPGEGLPFHPTCFEIYRRVCELRVGYIEIAELYRWDGEGVYRDTSIERATAEYVSFIHIAGDEWLAANPIDIPTLAIYLNVAAQRHQEELGWPAGTRGAPLYQIRQGRSGRDKPENLGLDFFEALPRELFEKVIFYLDRQSVKRLRFVTRAAEQIPLWYFKRLIEEYAPWLWEVDELPGGTHWPSVYFYATSNFYKGMRNRRRIWYDAERIVEILLENKANRDVSPASSPEEEL